MVPAGSFPKEMLEVRFHARAGQGAKSAAQILAEAILHEGCYTQAFPQYGPERWGAPVTTFVRFSPRPISIHSLIEHPNFAVVLDPTLINSEPVTAGLAMSSYLLINTPYPPSEIKTTLKHPGDTITLNASEMAEYFLGRNLPNLIMLGVLVKGIAAVWGAGGFHLPLSTLEKVVRDKFSTRWGKEVAEKNIIAMRMGFKEVEFNDQ